MWSTLLFISDKLYNPEKEEDFDAICNKLEKFCFSTEIPETYYGDLTDKDVIDFYHMTHPCTNEEILRRELAEATDADYIDFLNECLEELDGSIPTIEEYYNSLEEYTVRDGKLYTTRNYIEGIFDFIDLYEFSNRISTTGTTSIMMQRKDFAMIDENFEDVSLVILDDGLVSYERSLLWSEGEDNKYNQTITEVINGLNSDMYIYSFSYHF